MVIANVNFEDSQKIYLMIGCDTDGDFYLCIDDGAYFIIKPSEWDFFIEKLQQVKQLLQQQEDESNNQ